MSLVESITEFESKLRAIIDEQNAGQVSITATRDAVVAAVERVGAVEQHLASLASRVDEMHRIVTALQERELRTHEPVPHPVIHAAPLAAPEPAAAPVADHQAEGR